jgi:hypothetical protein
MYKSQEVRNIAPEMVKSMIVFIVSHFLCFFK